MLCVISMSLLLLHLQAYYRLNERMAVPVSKMLQLF